MTTIEEFTTADVMDGNVPGEPRADAASLLGAWWDAYLREHPTPRAPLGSNAELIDGRWKLARTHDGRIRAWSTHDSAIVDRDGTVRWQEQLDGSQRQRSFSDDFVRADIVSMLRFHLRRQLVERQAQARVLRLDALILGQQRYRVVYDELVDGRMQPRVSRTFEEERLAEAYAEGLHDMGVAHARVERAP